MPKSKRSGASSIRFARTSKRPAAQAMRPTYAALSSVATATGQSEDAATKEFERTFITTPDKAADQILRAVRKNKRRVLVGPDAKAFDLMVRTLPSSYQRVATGAVKWRSQSPANG